MALSIPPEPIVRGATAVRRLRLDDAPAYAQAFEDDPELGRLIGVEAAPTQESVRARVEADREASEDDTRRAIELAIADARSDAFRGSVLLHSYSSQDERAEIGFWVVASARRGGVALAAVSAVIDWAFSAMELRRVEMTTTPENPVVPAFARRLGFVHEGTLRARNAEQGRIVDILWFGLLRDEWSPG